MAKPTKHAPAICTVLSILAVVGIIIGFIVNSPLPLIFLLLPTIGYEIYRTEGESTRIASIVILVIMILEIILIIFNIDFNIADYLQQDSQYVGGYWVPLGSLKVVGPTVMAVLAVVLFVKTYGPFTKWLAVIIFISSFAIIYQLDPVAFQDLFKYGIKEAVDRLSGAI